MNHKYGMLINYELTSFLFMSSNNPEKNQQLLQENARLHRAVEELSILNELAREIGASSNSNEVMKKVISRSLRAVHAEQGTITLVEENESDAAKTFVRSMVSTSDHQPYHLTQALLGWMFLNKKPLMVNDPQDDNRFLGLCENDSVQSIMSVPLLVKSQLRGVLTVINKKGTSRFDEDDQKILSIIATQSAQVVENARLYEEEQAFLKMQSELHLAREIQMELLPQNNPQMDGYDIAGFSQPAQDVGGDYYDFIKLSETQLVTCLGDVSGKGIPAALLMSNLQATIRGQSFLDCRPGECLKKTNALLFHCTAAHKFATFFYGILNSKNHQFCYSNAGHDRPILFRDENTPRVLEEAGIALSLFEEFEFPEVVIDFQPNDLLFVYSDGVSESMNENDEEFGVANIIKFVQQKKNLSAKGIITNLMKVLENFSKVKNQHDDITMLVIKRIL
jgi:phosphoserine phosphatase RsbU/P